MDYNVTWRKKDKGWQFIISYKDSIGKWKQKSKQGFKTQKDGKPVIDKMLKELKKNVKTVNKSYNKLTFSEFADIYVEHEKLYKSIKTIESLITVLHKFEDLNKKEMCKITTLDIQKIVDKVTKEGLNNNTTRYYLKRLNTLFKSAKEEYNIIDSMPTKNIKVGKPVPTKKKALTDNEIKNLLEDFKNNKYYLLNFLAVNTGMRLGELLGITWDNVDFKNNTITVNKQWKKIEKGVWGFGDVKSKNSNRTIPVSNIVIKELMNHRNVININNRVLNFRSTNSVCAIVNGKFKKHGYTITFHELRHTYATRLIANGVDFKTAAQILGHSVEQTLKTYSHVNNDMLNKAHSVIEKIF
ncbi:site-specific integrase [Clostridium botulinum]|uniref:Site-specific recombinase, phage integrase family n=1 Tax=Clostridium botulinum (strain Okra / Type B1) TaxID=498213 RepID=B1IGR4_CLOBK|nr:tyrosine-type recombinase/integrase [Clostridium botulinum]EKX80484.1 phage integrase site specific recombinase [Clostridium botulinum CFSAN001628]ACA46661.1 site-specific recombinase, phage integrase family [Clostridium botulinum B1 str. Okra]MBD5564016.1 site-specific integrase [Clostridium botulinum]MBD5566613.1 site-specific integrase [Clostridium botulinum]MBD5568871.1 site-specific integrase [Clostridium botulinum]